MGKLNCRVKPSAERVTIESLRRILKQIEDTADGAVFAADKLTRTALYDIIGLAQAGQKGTE